MRKVLAVAALFAAAGSPAAAQMHGGESVEIPLRLHGGRLLVPVEAPDGTVFEFALSTGNGHTVLSESVAAHLEGRTELTMGGLPVPMEESATISNERLGTDGSVVDGMIGSNMLNDFDVLIDVPGQRLVLKPIGPSVSWEDMTMSEPIRVRVLHGLLLALDVELNGRKYKAMLDVGTPGLVVNEPVRAETQLADEDRGTLTVGNTLLPDLPVRVRDLELFRRWDPNNDGFVVVGASVARDCAISISWVRQEVRTCVR